MLSEVVVRGKIRGLVANSRKIRGLVAERGVAEAFRGSTPDNATEADYIHS